MSFTSRRLLGRAGVIGEIEAREKLRLPQLFHVQCFCFMVMRFTSCKDDNFLILGLGFNPWTPRSEQHVNSPYNFKEVSVRQVLRMKNIIN